MNDKTKKSIIYILSTIIAVIIIIYILIQLFSSVSNAVTTSPAILVTEKEINSFDSYIIRNENIVYSSVNGYIKYQCNDGEKVSIGDLIATIYYGIDDNVGKELLRLDEAIDVLVASGVTADMVTSDTATLDTKTYTLLSNIETKLNKGDLSYAINNKNTFLSYINRKELMVDNIVDYTQQLASIIATRDQLIVENNVQYENVFSDRSGYFFKRIDGYENYFSSVDIDTFTIDAFQSIVTYPEDKTLINLNGNYAIGKISDDYYWYVAAEVSYSPAHSFVVGRTYNVIYPEYGDTEVPALLYRTITEPGNDKAILVFKNGYTLNGFDYQRNQNVQVISSSYTGYKVPVTAIRVVDGVKGVYILKGSEVVFRTIEPIYEKNGFLIVERKDSENAEHKKRLNVNENIITDGNEYYDGMLIG